MASVPTLGAGSAHPLPTTAAADDALREALARQAAARAVAEAADQRAADLLAAAGAASSSSSTPLTTLPQSPVLAAAAADAAGRNNAILEAARRSFAIGAQASGNHPEQRTIDAINTLYTAERSKIDATIFNVYESKLKARELNERMRLLVTSITLLKKLVTRLVNLAIAVPAGQRSQFETAVQLVQCKVDEHDNRKLVADGEVLMVGYADNCWSVR